MGGGWVPWAVEAYVPVVCCAHMLGGQSQHEWVPGDQSLWPWVPLPRPHVEMYVQGICPLKTGGVSLLVTPCDWTRNACHGNEGPEALPQVFSLCKAAQTPSFPHTCLRLNFLPSLSTCLGEDEPDLLQKINVPLVFA